MKKFIMAGLLTIMVVLAGCTSEPETAEEESRYHTEELKIIDLSTHGKFEPDVSVIAVYKGEIRSFSAEYAKSEEFTNIENMCAVIKEDKESSLEPEVKEIKKCEEKKQ